MQHERDTQKLLNELDHEQSPVTWPETLNEGRAVDEFLWKGDPKATPVQRVGLVIFAAIFLPLFVGAVVAMIVMIVKHDFDWPSFLVVLMLGTLSGIAGFRFLFNAFRHQKHQKVNR